MRIFQLALALVVVGMFAAGLTTYIADANKTFNQNLSETEYSTFQRISEVRGNASNIQRALSNQTGIIEGEGVDLPTSLFSASYEGIKIIFNLPNTAYRMITDGFTLVKHLGIPAEFQSGLIAITILIVVFGILYAFFKIRF